MRRQHSGACLKHLELKKTRPYCASRLGTMPSAPLLLGQAYRSPNIEHTSKTRQGKAQSRARSAALYSLTNSCSLTAKNALLLIPLQAGSMGEGFAKDPKRLSLCGEWRE